MKEGRPLAALAAELERQKSARYDVIAKSQVLRVTDAGRLTIPVAADSAIVLPENSVAMSRTARRQLGEHLDIPAKYLERMLTSAPELFARNANHWLQSEPSVRLIRVLDGMARAILSDSYRRIDNPEVAEVVLPMLMQVPGINIRSCEVTERRMYIKATTSEVTAPIKGSRRTGDFVEAGVMIANSDTGHGALSIKPFMNFLVCTNGMVMDKGAMRAKHVGRRADTGEEDWVVLSETTQRLEDAATLSKIRDTVAAALDAVEFRQRIGQLEALCDKQIRGDVPAAVQLLSNDLSLTGEESSGVLRHLVAGGDLSQYGLMNAVTRTAQDCKSYDRATELESAGGAMIEMRDRQWQTIANAAAVS